jgi:hypothetical protein
MNNLRDLPNYPAPLFVCQPISNISSMPRKNPRSRARKELPTTNKPVITNFDVVLRAVRAALKLDWCFYEEALEGVVRAGAQGGDVTPW